MPEPPESAAAICWWCGALANSREHKFKQSELRLSNGRGPWKDESAVVHSAEGDLRTVQGPNADSLKFKASLCQECNNARSQPFDRAYDKFIEYMAANASTIGIDRRFRFSEIYGDDWPMQRTYLIKYWVKHIGCRAVDYGLAVPQRLRDYLNGEIIGAPPHIQLALTVQVDALRLILHDGMPYGSFINSEVQPGGDVLQGHSMWGWVRTVYMFSARDQFGSTNFEDDLVQMGWISLVSPEYTLDPPI